MKPNEPYIQEFIVLKNTFFKELLSHFEKRKLLLLFSLFLAVCLYHLSLLVGLPGYILCPYRAVVDKF